MMMLDVIPDSLGQVFHILKVMGSIVALFTERGKPLREKVHRIRVFQELVNSYRSWASSRNQ